MDINKNVCMRLIDGLELKLDFCDFMGLIFDRYEMIEL